MTNPIQSKQRRLAYSVGLFLFSLYLLGYRGGFHSVDELSMFAVTESLVKFGQVNTDQIAWTQWTTSQAEAQGFFGEGGHVYSKKGLALSLAQAPLYWLALHLPYIGLLQTVSLLNALITAATAAILYLFAWRLDPTPEPSLTALAVALIFGLATISAVYAKYLFSEPLAGFLLILTAYMLFTYRQEGGWRHLIIAGIAAGLSVLTRANNLFLLPMFALYLLWVEGLRPYRFSKPIRSMFTQATFPLLTFIISIALSGVILLAYNNARSGDPFKTGYDLSLFSPNVLLGLYKLLFSPLRGFFIYSPILLLSIPGWWQLRRSHPAEAWLIAGCIGLTLALFSAWSSGEGLSWGSRFLVPLVPFFALCLTPIISYQQSAVSSQQSAISSQQSAVSSQQSAISSQQSVVSSQQSAQTSHFSFLISHFSFLISHLSPLTSHLSLLTSHLSPLTSYLSLLTSRFSPLTSRFLPSTFYLLLSTSFLIQLLAIVINPWVYLNKLQTEFGGEFFLEKTAALYDFRYSQIMGQLQSWSIANSDLIWWQPWGLDWLALSLTLSLIFFTSLTLYKQFYPSHLSPLTSYLSPPTFYLLLSTFYLLTHYQTTDLQFGPPDDPYNQALATAVSQTGTTVPIINVAQYHYHVPMNRFKVAVPMLGLAQQRPPMPETALPLLKNYNSQDSVWLITVGFPPAAPDNAAEQWLTFNGYKAQEQWFGETRLLRYSTEHPTLRHALNLTLADEVELSEAAYSPTRRAGQLLPVKLTWRVSRRPAANYNVFLQLLNAQGQLVAQNDNPPNGGYTNTNAWFAGERVVSRAALALPNELPVGNYRLIGGLYNPADGQRLTLKSGADFVELGTVEIRQD